MSIPFLGLAVELPLPSPYFGDGCLTGEQDRFLARRFARHASAITTIIYTHPPDEDLYPGVKDLPR